MRTVTQADFALAETAVRLTRKLDQILDSEERFSVALTGILAASRDHDPEKASWPTYAVNKARFAIHDEFRSRAGRKWQKVIKFQSIEAASDSLKRRFEAGGNNEGTRLNDRNALPDESNQGHDTHADTVEGLARKLPPQSGEAFRLHWLHGLTLKDVGKRLGVTESRACQIMAGAYAMLRELVPPDFFAKGGAA